MFNLFGPDDETLTVEKLVEVCKADPTIEHITLDWKTHPDMYLSRLWPVVTIKRKSSP